MRENILKLSGAILLASALVGCGGSSSSDSKPAPTPAKPDAKKCNYTGVPTKLTVGDTFKVMVKDSLGNALTSTVTGKVDTTKVGSYPITVMTDSCDPKETKYTVVVEKKKTPADAGTVKDGYVDPF